MKSVSRMSGVKGALGAPRSGLGPSTPDTRGTHASGLLWALLPHAVFALLFVVTFRRWILPFSDSGREMNTAWRVASGEALYRDVGWSYGPLAPLLDAALLRLFGRNVDVLVAWRTLLGVAGVELLRRLARRLAADAASGSAIAAFAVAACAFGVGGSWPFPYSAAALLGMVLTWAALECALSSTSPWASASAGLLAGLASACKIEIGPAALPALVLGLLSRRRWREAAGAAAVACVVAGSAYGLPVAWYGVPLMRRQGFLIAFDVPEAWRRVYERHVIFGDMSRGEFLGGRFVEIFVPSALFLGALFFLARRRALDGPAASVILFAAAAGSVVPWPENQGLHVLLPAALVLSAAALGGGLLRLVRGDPAGSERAALAAATLPPLLRQPFFLRNPTYFAFSAPLALVAALGWASRRVAARRAFLAAVLGLAAAQAAHRWWGIGRVPLVLTKLPGLTAYLVPMEARLLEEAAAEVEKRVPPGGAVAVFPEPGTVLFVTNRKNPFVDELFLPGVQDTGAEDEMIWRLGTDPPVLVLVTNRPFGEYGSARFGRGVLDRFFAELNARYVPAGRLGGGPTMARRASEALVLIPRPAEAAPPAR